jgi:excisionase family DNA binding protein
MNTTTLIQMHPDDLQELIKQAVAEAVGMLPKPEQAASYLTRKEVCKKFGVGLTTLHNWHKRGVLPSTKVGGRVVYREKDIQAAINKGLDKWKKAHE